MDPDALEIVAAVTEGTVEAFMRTVGAPVVELSEWGAAIIRRRRSRAESTGRVAAQQVADAGLLDSVQPVEDKLLVEILEGASLQPDPEETTHSEAARAMRARWAALLANAAVGEAGADVPASFPTLLAELEPTEAAALEWLAALPVGTDLATFLERFGYSQIKGGDWRPMNAHADNLARLRLCDVRIIDPDFQNVMDKLPRPLSRGEKPPVADVQLTDLGRAFIEACSPPTNAHTGAQAD